MISTLFLPRRVSRLVGFSFVLLNASALPIGVAGATDLIQLKDTNYCLNTPYRSDYGDIFLWQCEASDPDQQWVVEGDLFRLKNTNYCLNTPYRADYGEVFLWTCNSGDPDQQWQQDGDLIRLKNTSYCLNTPDRANYGNIFLWTCNSGDPDQKWVIGGGGGGGGACPSYGWYCGGSVGQNPDYLYFCSAAGADPVLEEACANGCTIEPPGTPDHCTGACPDYGWYCGGSVGQNPDYLYFCSAAGADPVLEEACTNGCQINPPGTPDQCIGTCPDYGWFCGGSVGQDPNNLYFCTEAGAEPELEQTCSNGCQVEPPGTPDHCIGLCPGYGWYCGGSVGQNPDYLYFCSATGAEPTLQEACSLGCQVEPPGTADHCIGTCPDSGWYCGTTVGQDPNNLYYCTGANAIPQLSQTCQHGCQINPPGTPDQCSADTCPDYGWYCGSSVGEDPNNVYFCTTAAVDPQLAHVCGNGCQVNPPGTKDVCAAGGPCPDYGWFCGGSVGQDPGTLYFCTAPNAVAQVSQVCTNGCQVNPPGIRDVCIVGSGDAGFCENMPDSEWHGAGTYCNGDVLVICSAYRETISQQFCGVNSCQQDFVGGLGPDSPLSTPSGPYCAQLPEQLDPSGTSSLFWPFSNSSWNSRMGWYLVEGAGSGAHAGGDYYGQAWGKGTTGFSCGEKVRSPIYGTVIYAGSTVQYGTQVTIQSLWNPEFAVRVSNLASGDALIGDIVGAGVTELGDIGSGTSTACDSDIILYKNISQNYDASTTGLQRLQQGLDLGLSGGANTFAASFNFDAAGEHPDTQFTFPVQPFTSYKVEYQFGFGGGPHPVWYDCDGGSDPNNSGREYHAGIDLIGENALGTLEVTDHGWLWQQTQQEADCWVGAANAPVFAVANGTVVESSGERVTILHNAKTETGQPVYSVYMHIDRIVEDQQDIRYGEQVGSVLADNQNNPHLHFEMRTFPEWATYGGYTAGPDPRLNGFLDPCTFLSQHGAAVPSSCHNMTPLGGMVPDRYGAVSADFTAGAAPNDLLVTMFPLEEGQTHPLSEGYELVNNAYEIVAQDETENLIMDLGADATVTLKYYSQNLDTVDEGTLTIHRFDAGLNEWLALPSTVDPIEQDVEATTQQLGEFSLLGQDLNDPPQITSAPLTTAMEDELYQYDVEATDPDGNVLTYSLLEQPEGMAIENTTGLITWLPDNSDVGDHAVNIEVSDAELTASQTYTLSVANVNDPPVVNTIPDQTVYRGEAFASFDVDMYGSDPDAGDQLTWTSTGNTALLVTIDSEHIVTIEIPEGWTGSEQITFTATDSAGATASTAPTFRVQAARPGPGKLPRPGF